MRGHETIGLLGCGFRYRHRRLEPQKEPKISTMIVIGERLGPSQDEAVQGRVAAP